MSSIPFKRSIRHMHSPVILISVAKMVPISTYGYNFIVQSEAESS